MESSNPVLSRLDDTARVERQVLGAGAVRAMTVDDVVVRTVVLLVLTGGTGAIAWTFLTDGWAGAAGVGSALAGLVLALVISIRRITNPVVIGAYAILQGVLLGVASRGFEAVYPGIVVQAVVGTFGVFAGMAVLYGLRVLRATPRFTRMVIGALIGVVVLSLVNFVVYLIAGRQALEIYSTTSKVGWLPYVFALVCITVGALTFILDFDLVERGARDGLPTRYAWYCAFGLLVGLIFLYWQILRLLSYIRR
ncbi:Bax inhibitor-1/YccA family protein [Plantactinospora solaniradicis]|uniref:Bax inhibitor-1/YccA family protein n=1 Tax=Plantactinospora solaniradicis TaxID=1723736 RepID=A0ABW1KCQ0_9ACTN